MNSPTKADVYAWLEDVKDPEIPVLSLNDLGVITDVQIEDGKVLIEMTPTFVGCPALDIMKDEISKVLAARGLKEVVITVSYRHPWSTDKISEKGKQALKKFGLAPPPTNALLTDIDLLEHATCPYCNGTNTEVRSLFGPTLCRSIHYCNNCREAFEQFKPL